MRSIIELIGLNDLQLAIDSRAIFAVSEMDEERELNNRGQEYVKCPKHRAIFTDKNIFRVLDSYDDILKKIKNSNINEDLGYEINQA